MVSFDDIQVGDVVEIASVGVVSEARGLIGKVVAKLDVLMIISDKAIHSSPLTKNECMELGICLRNVGRRYFSFRNSSSIKKIVSKSQTKI